MRVRTRSPLLHRATWVVGAAIVAAALVGCEVEQTPWPGRDAGADDRGVGSVDRGGLGHDMASRPDMAARDMASDGIVAHDMASDGMSPIDDGIAPLDAGHDALPLDMGAPDAAPPDLGAPDMDPPPLVYRYVVIADDSPEENTSGTAGADVCGVRVECDGREVAPLDATLVLGAGVVCDGTPNAVCGMTRREDPHAALDDGATCTGASSPSDYVSLGVAGELAIDFGRALDGCRLTVVELIGRDSEAYDVYLCARADVAVGSCRGDVPVARSPGGAVSVDL